MRGTSMEDSYVLELLEPKFKDFHLVYCGYAQCEARHSYGPATRPKYIRWVGGSISFPPDRDF